MFACVNLYLVAPLAGAWIEMSPMLLPDKIRTWSLPSRERGLKCSTADLKSKQPVVAPLAGAWIEIIHKLRHYFASKSLPSRERGLKFPVRDDGTCIVGVAPLAGAWIEIFHSLYSLRVSSVAPLAGAWIEILRNKYRRFAS